MARDGKRASLFIGEPEPKSRLDLFLRSRGIRPLDFAREANQSRQHLLRVRNATLQPTLRKIAAMVSAARRLTLEAVKPEDLFELVAEEGGQWINADARRRTIQAATATADLRKAAAELVHRLFRYPISEWARRIRDANGVNEPVVRRLIQVGYRELDRNAIRSEAILAIAQELTSDLTSTIPELRVAFRGRTLLYRARAFFIIGKYDEALATLDAAEREYEGTPFCTNDLVQTWYERAAVLFKRGELDQASRVAKRAINIFSLLGDARRVAKTRIIQGGVLYEKGDIRAARDQWLLVIEPLRMAEDYESVACISLNIGSAETLLNDPASANHWLGQALALFQKIGNQGEMIRTRWSLAKLRLLHEDRSEGLQMLRFVRSDFLAAEMPAEAGFVAMDLIEQLLGQEDAREEVVVLCRSAVDAFHKAGANAKMLEALAYLREAVRTQSAEPDLVRQVRTFLERAAQGSDTRFMPHPC